MVSAYGRQWLPPGSQIGIQEELDEFWNLFHNKKYERAKSKAKKIGVRSNLISCKNNRKFGAYIDHLQKMANFYSQKILSETISVYVVNFWDNFSLQNSAIKYFLSRSLGKRIIEVKSPLEADLCLTSIFTTPQKNQNTDHLFKVTYIGERVSPSFTECDLSLSMDLSDYGGKNIYCPLWLMHLIENKIKANTSLIDLVNQINLNNQSMTARAHRAIFVGSNDHPMRQTIINAIKDLGIETDSFGSHYRPLENKIVASEKYTFSVCPENCWSPGYTTEKIIDALIAGCIPLYWGYLDSNIFNVNRVININYSNSSRSNITNELAQGLSKSISKTDSTLSSHEIKKLEDKIVDSINTQLAFLL